MNELLIELFSEEIPASLQQQAVKSYYEIFSQYFKVQGIDFASLHIYSSPCRITIYGKDINAELANKKIEVRGPKLDATAEAVSGFCRSYNITEAELSIRQINNNKYYIYSYNKNQQSVKELLSTDLPQLIAKYSWSKSMYWGNYKIKWVRPLHNILCIFSGEVINFTYGHLQANNHSFGHKIMSPDKLIINNFADYKKQLSAHYVMFDQQERQHYITTELAKAANQLNLTLGKKITDLIEEVTALVEYPQILTGHIARQFLALPQELLISSMQHHQKYFCLFNPDGQFAPYFLFVANIKSSAAETIIYGNEKVLSARLADALYFYNQDLKTTLAAKTAELAKVIFHAKLGNLQEKTERLVKLCRYIAPDNIAAMEAARICKSDIVSEVVKEFPELQGIMGYYYATAEGLNDSIALAIKDHYKDSGYKAGAKNSGAVLALADKIDNLCGLFIAGEQPTGSGDPYALRRQALGIIRIILSSGIDQVRSQVRLKDLINYAADLFQNKLTVSLSHKHQILTFIEERVRYFLKEQYDIAHINAILNLTVEDDLLAVKAKLESLKYFMESKGKELLAIYKRINNILAGSKLEGSIDPKLFNSKYETELFNFVTKNEQEINRLLLPNTNSPDQKYQQKNHQKDHQKDKYLITTFELHINNFFNNILVNDPDPVISNNRQLLLNKIKMIFDLVAEFAYL